MDTVNVVITRRRSNSQTSTVKMVALLLKAEDKDDMRAAIMTAIIKPTRPVGNTFSTSLQNKIQTIFIIGSCLFYQSTNFPWIIEMHFYLLKKERLCKRPPKCL